MRVIHKDFKQGAIKLVAENLDDIWHIYNLIDVGDLVQAVSYRTDEQKADKIRSKKTEKKRMKLGVRVEKTSFHEFSDRLRIHGVIEEGPQDLGSYHTFNIDAEKLESFTIIKPAWLPHHLQRIDEAVKQRLQPIVAFVSLDEDAATIAVLRQSGIQTIATIDSHRSGKMFESSYSETEYFNEILRMLKTVVTTESPVMIVGPGFTREHFIKYGKEHDPDLFSNTRTHSTGNAEMNGIQEALKTGVVDQITKENRVVKETQYIEKIFEEIQKNGLISYGYCDVLDAANKGAVKQLLISDIFVRTPEGESILRLARERQSDFMIINTLHEAGKKFIGIGGIAAFLRFRI
ncbi:MAG: mRNA surveillance protein pelota [Candidatus Thermoplasmatota archaeon]|nr:mRNA surveillance protein pelota [Candidatus Thermoplasmatota archaeon]MBU1941473.1 mRNA surveillance protein pelota [Candidatus Thermoplasmatota archaeon]